MGLPGRVGVLLRRAPVSLPGAGHRVREVDPTRS